MNTTVSYSYDPDIGIPIDELRGAITLVDDACHVKVWKDSETGVVTVCIVPKYGEVSQMAVRDVGHRGVGGPYPAHFICVYPDDDIPPQKTRQGKVIHGHEWNHPAIEDRSPSNWCSICKDWFVPDYFSRKEQDRGSKKRRTRS